MKKFYHLAFALGTAGVLFFAGIDSDNGKAGATGSPGENNCRNCHNTYALNSTLGSIAITSTMTNWEYVPGQTYQISVTVAQTGKSLFGLGFEALLPSGANAGTLTAGTGTTIKNATVSGNSRRNIVQQLNGGASSGTHTFTFTWAAPATDVGAITFYAAGDACNANGATSGDYVYTTSQVVNPAPAGIVEDVVTPFTFSFYPNPATENITMNYSLEESSKVTYIIYDLTGKQVQTESATRFPGAQQQTVDVNSLQAGTYLLSVNANGNAITKRFVKK
jgi:hypothetical protein